MIIEPDALVRRNSKGQFIASKHRSSSQKSPHKKSQTRKDFEELKREVRHMKREDWEELHREWKNRHKGA